MDWQAVIQLVVEMLGVVLLGMGWWPCCCGCSAIASDNFNRASIGANWTVVSGTWDTVSSTDLRCQSDNGLIYYSATAASDVRMRATVYHTYDPESSDATPVRVIICYKDANEYFYLESRPGSNGANGNPSLGARFKIGERQAGVDTDLTGEVPWTDSSYCTTNMLSFCWDGTVLSATISEPQYTSPTQDYAPGEWGGDLYLGFQAKPSFTPTGTYGALGTGTSPSSSLAHFDNWTLLPNDPPTGECPHCVDCHACEGNTTHKSRRAPRRVQVVISGISDDVSMGDPFGNQSLCSNCSSLNGTHILTYAEGYYYVCRWVKQLSTDYCPEYPDCPECHYMYLQVTHHEPYGRSVALFFGARGPMGCQLEHDATCYGQLTYHNARYDEGWVDCDDTSKWSGFAFNDYTYNDYYCASLPSASIVGTALWD